MADLLAALMDVYYRLSYDELQDPVEVVLEQELDKYDIGVDPEVMRKNLEKLRDGVGLAESTRDLKATSDKEGKAKGYYQWLTEVPKTKENPAGEGQPAFQTALNRLSRYYEKGRKRIAPWILKAKEHNDPTKLTKRQQDALFYADVFQRKGTTTEFGEGYEQGKLQEIMRTGNPDIMNKVYLDDWHTKPPDMSQDSWQKVMDNARRSFY